METNKKTKSADEEIALASSRSSGIKIIGDIDPYFGGEIALPESETIHVKLSFDSNCTFDSSYAVTDEIVSLYLDTGELEGHDFGFDNAYTFIITSPDTQFTCELIDTDAWSRVSNDHGNYINTTILLSDKKLYKIRIIPDERKKQVTINANVSYTIYRDIGIINVDKNQKTVYIRRNDKCKLHFQDSIEYNCTWQSSNPNVISVGRNTGQITAHKLGTAVITLSNNCGTVKTINIKSVVEHVYITDDKTSPEKIHFKTTGRTWHTVYHNTVFESTRNDMIADRNKLNYFIEYDPDSDIAGVGVQTFSKEELSLLYVMDPHGVANYVKTYAEENIEASYLEKEYLTKDNWQNDLRAKLKYKDDIFFSIFGRKPSYFVYNDKEDKWYETAETWYKTTDVVNLKRMVSESESIFGFHSVTEAGPFFDFVLSAIEIGTMIFTKIDPKFKEKAEALSKYKDFLSLVIISLTSEDVRKDLFKKTTDIFIKTLDAYPLNWFSTIGTVIKGVNSVAGLVHEMNMEPHYVKPLLNHCVNTKNYDINIDLKKGLATKFRDILDVL